MVYENMLKAKKELEKNIKLLASQIEKLPEGTIVCARNGKNYKWYRSDGHDEAYIHKKDRKLAEKLALKKYCSLRMEDAKKELKATKAYLKKYEPSQKLKELFEQPSEYRNLLETYLKPEKEDLLAWMQEDYEKNPHYPEMLIHKSISGRFLRSKSEAMIDSYLFRNKIPYRYEEEMQLGHDVWYPDFTIRHPNTGKKFIWEHFGFMDDPKYRRKTIRKIDSYISNGYIPMVNFITTFETKDNPLGMDVIEEIIQHYFLD